MTTTTSNPDASGSSFEPIRRRGGRRLLDLGVAFGFLVATLSAVPGTAGAANGQPIVLGSSNSASSNTTVSNTGTNDGCTFSLQYVGLIGCGSVGLAGGGYIGVHAKGTGAGVRAESSHTGVYSSGSQYGVEGVTNTGVGIRGSSTGATGVGIQGEVSGTGAAVYGMGRAKGVGVFGESSDATGVLASSTNGKALRVTGKAEFSRSGVATVAAKGKSIKVTAVSGLTNTAMVFTTAQGNVAGVWIQGVKKDPATSSFVIYLNKATPTALPIAWFVIENPR